MAMMDNSLRSAVNPVARIALPWLAVIVAAIFSGTLAAGNANSVLGQKPALLLLGALVAGSFLVMFLFLGSSAVLVWPVAATGGYLLQVQIGRAHV